MTAGSSNKEIVWDLLRSLTSADAQTQIAGLGLIPIRRDVDLPEASREYVLTFLNNLEHAQSYPLHLHSIFVQSAIDEALAPVWNQEQPVNAVLEELQNRLSAEL